jgi:hypothetical protein
VIAGVPTSVKTAKALGVEPSRLLWRADEVIE